ncbi:hypothetical protein EIP86_000299 [Pleurotus ostreatoroseus]|nr:hypothetical protein EIP86_000299 [Pleurotus ostreatoroseus]
MLHLHARALTRRLKCPLPRSLTSHRRGLHADRSIYVSKSTNPYFNLTLEDWCATFFRACLRSRIHLRFPLYTCRLFRHKSPKEPLLLLYRDDPCVVIGRNQNPWKEVNLAEAERTGTSWIRRRSGGGTVYHDLGNTNFSIHLPRSSFDRDGTAQVVLRAVRALGVDANVNDRNDICVGKDKIHYGRLICSVRHVSGSAYKIVNNRAYHHGTMLISTKLDSLGNLLRTNKETMHTKGIASVRSPVRNLQQYDDSVTHEKFVEAVIDSFRQEYSVYEVEENEEAKTIEYIHHGMDELPRWEWAFGQTPEFTYDIEQAFQRVTVTAHLRSKHGVILDCSIESRDATDDVRRELRLLGSRLAGQKYAFVDESVLELQGADTPVVQEVWAWLKDKMAR